MSSAWRFRQTTSVQRDVATLIIRPFHRLSTADTDALTAERERLLEFVAANASTRDIQFEQ